MATDGQRMVDQVFNAVNTYLGKNLAKLIERLENIERRFSELPTPKDGRDGERGQQGEIGPLGPQGERGVPGEAGPQGAHGDTGLQGARGIDGPQGPQGERGEKGDTGEDGSQGERGAQGEKGESGARGLEGAQGLPGERGLDGEKGERGPQGVQGAQGECGIAGKDGALGPQGERGIDGKEGPQGEAGERGINGKDGALGPQGERGMDGAAGEDGRDGRDGSPGTPGRDATQIEVLAELEDDRSYVRGTFAHHRGGLVRAARNTDPLNKKELLDAGWVVVVNGIAELLPLWSGRKFGLGIMLTNGVTVESVTSFAVPVYRGVWREGTYEHGDQVTFGGSQWHCQRDGVISKPGVVPADWTLCVKRGADGKDGRDGKDFNAPVKIDIQQPRPTVRR